MAQEIERKFLVKADFKPMATKKKSITQAYLSSVPGRTVRIRIEDEKGFLTIKGSVNASGTTRFEWEKEILQEEAKTLLALCEPGVIHKTRYIIPEDGGLKFEVDEFYGDNEGLIVAEIELPAEDHQFVKPEWLGEEVTGNPKYFNSMLRKKPFKNW
ncbi:MAG: CYTH domain-containing protein [Bacteroidales bacterium]|nr:CYTH domain-containing protein [Bacteroidales bacterium]MCF6341480.1 CYTH domain-containing protein [Bacteroidales bacterium]